MEIPPRKIFETTFPEERLRHYIPEYMLQPSSEKPIKEIDKLIIMPFLYFIKLYLLIFTRNWEKVLNSSIKKLSHQQINDHYTKLAFAYEERHHKITNKRDIWWRRQIGFDVASILKQTNMTHLPILLDLCTGIGLSIEEILKVFQLEGISVKVYGLDCNKEMLNHANQKILSRMREAELLTKDEREVEFVYGNATDLVAKKAERDELRRFSMNSIDCITILCGIGGVENPKLSFEQQLKILRPGGVIIMFDMHKPLPDLSSPWPISPLRLWSVLEKKGWEEITLKLVLRKLWAWNDPTESFYILPLTTYYDSEKNKYYGFNIVLLELNTEPWFFGLPGMPTAKIIVKKVEITSTESVERELALKAFETGCFNGNANIRSI